jgi:hypothetical protein
MPSRRIDRAWYLEVAKVKRCLREVLDSKVGARKELQFWEELLGILNWMSSVCVGERQVSPRPDSLDQESGCISRWYAMLRRTASRVPVVVGRGD